eukprot:TRINITY_DN8884_c0_g1_i2.p1 TRINITY_DN8884_c0_g1~~TRINITY_DN8884_c0_g1_i2.p1  ORF type:complete len:245 (+),score=27.56 TRINITY_DN8884_c0_g1_i2:38-772(+)
MSSRRGDPGEEYLLHRETGNRGIAHRPSASALKYGDAPVMPVDSRDRLLKKEGGHFCSWKGLTITLMLMSAAIVVALCVILVFHFYYRRCDVWLSDVSINELVTDPSGDTATGVLAFTIEARNPTRSAASVTRASFRLEFVDDVHMVSDTPASAHITFPDPPDTWSPTNSSGHIPIYSTDEGTVQIISSNFPLDVKDSKLVHSGCFGIQVTGEITYSVSTVSYTTYVDREFKLFEECPCKQNTY